MNKWSDSSNDVAGDGGAYVYVDAESFVICSS